MGKRIKFVALNIIQVLIPLKAIVIVFDFTMRLINTKMRRGEFDVDTPLNFRLSNEQQLLIEKALQGKNILVDACIGSGKTTAIQKLCNELPGKKKVLYLTYNKLLKLDAKAKIKKKNVTVTNYHGYAYAILQRSGISVGISDLIQTVIHKKPTTEKFDVLIIDEYQDI